MQRMSILGRMSVLLLAAAAVMFTRAPPASADVGRALRNLESRSFQTRLAAIESLAQSGDARAVEPIIRRLADRDATIRWAACEALEKLGDPRAVAALEKAAKDQSPLVSERAKGALASLRPVSPPGSGALAVRLIAKDNSKSGVGGIDHLLLENAERGLAGKHKIALATSESASHVVRLTVQSVSEKSVSGETVLEVHCTAMVVELPGNQLRFSTRIGAAVSKPGSLSASDREELITDAVRAAAEGLGEEAAEYLAKRP